jgi:hypothetical protein
VKSMALGADLELQQGRLRAVEMLTSNQMLIGQLQSEGFRSNIKELLTSTLEDLGLKDADRYFERLEQDEGQTQGAGSTPGGPQPDLQEPGLPGAPQADPAGGGEQQPMAQPLGL